MSDWIHKILAWSEVAALLLPLAFMIGSKAKLVYMHPIRIYVWTAFFILLAITLIFHYKYAWHFPKELMSNNFLYNLHSVVRFFLFAWFFILLRQSFLRVLKLTIPVVFLLFLLINFLVLEDFFNYSSLSGRLLSIEAGLLLLYCLQYYFFILSADTHEDRRPASFWVVTGLSIYVVINFPIFLFYKAMRYEFRNFAISIWDVHNISYIIFCCFLAKAFYEERRSNAVSSNKLSVE